jgi:hypothetical protein
MKYAHILHCKSLQYLPKLGLPIGLKMCHLAALNLNEM